MTLPTDEEMRAEIPAIAKPYVLERDTLIGKLTEKARQFAAERDAARRDAAALSRELDETRAERDDAVQIAEGLRCANAALGIEVGSLGLLAERHEGWLTIVDTIDDAEQAIAMFQGWRSTGYAGDPGSVARLGRIVTDETPAEAAATEPRCTCPNADCPCHPGDDPGPCDCAPKSMPPGRPPHSSRCGIDARGCVSDCPAFAWDLAHAQEDQAASPVADGPIATRFGEAFEQARSEDDPGEAAPAGSMLITPIMRELMFGAAAKEYRNAVRSAMTLTEHLHAAQLGARAHVVPHIKAAASAAMKDGDHDGATAYLAIAALINGDLDPQILRYGAAFLRFVQGAG